MAAETSKRGRIADNKTAVLGMAQQGGQLEASVIPNAKKFAILPSMGYRYASVLHTEKVYVWGKVHTNTIEGFWSNVKNGIRGVYHAVSAKYRKDVTPIFLTFLSRTSRQVDD